MNSKICMGNEAIALGAINAGVRVVAGYPGTPSTEIIETVIREHNPNVNVQWSTNEKAALEVAAGAAYAGARALSGAERGVLRARRARVGWRVYYGK